MQYSIWMAFSKLVTISSGERPFECDICRARFTLKHSMMRHRRKHTDPNAGGEMHSTSGEDENSRQEDDFTEGKISIQ